jgi:hypothetical protein
MVLPSRTDVFKDALGEAPGEPNGAFRFVSDSRHSAIFDSWVSGILTYGKW